MEHTRSSAGDTDRQSAIASIPQLLTGHALTDASTIRCRGCRDTLTLGDIVFAVASRDGSQYRWTVDRLYCWGCAPARCVSPGSDGAEAIVGGRLGQRTDPTGRRELLCLTELALRSLNQA